MKSLMERIENEARKTFMSLHRSRRNGYERGDCHCQTCSEKVDELVDHFRANGLIHEREDFGVYSPPVVVRRIALRKGWI